MKKIKFLVLTFPLLAALPPMAQAQDAGVTASRELVSRYCASCHNERLKTASLVLDNADISKPERDPAVWEKVIRKVQAGQMPPMGVPRPEQTALDSLVGYLETSLDRASAASPKLKSAVVHRLNRAEYANSIRDLLAVEIDAAALLPADDSGGFDNFADLLSVSPLLMERYMSAARKISRLAVGSMSIPADVETFEVPPFLSQLGHMSDELPFGSRGGVAVRYRFPLDAEYSLKARLRRVGQEGYVVGMAEPSLLDFRLDGKRVKLFTVGGEHKGRAEGQTAADNVPPDMNQAVYERNADDHLEIRFTATAGEHLVQLAFLDDSYINETAFAPNASKGFVNEGINRAGALPAVNDFSISGPFASAGSGQTASRQKIFTCRPGPNRVEEECARRILSALARRAYRRSLAPADLDALMGLYASARSAGFEHGIETALQGMLVSPDFLFRIERPSAGPAAVVAPVSSVSDVELASRLSFFLWSSGPDDDLLELAERGELSQPEMLERQVKRMLLDPRASALVENFAGQWLRLRNLAMHSPNRDVFPEYDDNLGQAFLRETELFVHHQLSQDRPILELLTADYTFLNERLAQHYGVAGVYGSRFRQVALTDPNRRGLLGHGSILSLTSLANRTSPVMRGKWVLETLIGTPPPPPPPNVPALRGKDEGGKELSMRQQMEEHRGNPTCSSCHRLMDPIGFAMENFNAIGGWRSADAGALIDASGTLPDGANFSGPQQLREALTRRERLFIQTATERMFSYALGRGLEPYDMPAVRQVLREAQARQYRWSGVIVGIVKSVPFRMRMQKG